MVLELAFVVGDVITSMSSLQEVINSEHTLSSVHTWRNEVFMIFKVKDYANYYLNVVLIL